MTGEKALAKQRADRSVAEAVAQQLNAQDTRLEEMFEGAEEEDDMGDEDLVCDPSHSVHFECRKLGTQTVYAWRLKQRFELTPQQTLAVAAVVLFQTSFHAIPDLFPFHDGGRGLCV